MSRLVRNLLILTFVCGTAAAQALSFLSSITINDSGGTMDVTGTVAQGDTLRFFYQDGGGTGNVPGLGSLTVTVGGQQICSGGACDGFSYSIQSAGAISIAVDGVAKSGGSFKFYLQCDPVAAQGSCQLSAKNSSGTGSASSQSGSGGASVDQQAAAAAAASKAAGAAGASSSAASGNAINAAISGRNTGPQASVTQNGLFLSTQGETSGINAWVALSGKRFTGDVEGQGGDLTLGADFEVGSNAVLGLALSVGRYSLEVDNVDLETTAVAVGPYGAVELTPGIELEGYLMVARPKYDTDAGDYDSMRTMLGLSLLADYNLGSIAGVGYARLSGFEERLSDDAPGGDRTITQSKASIGTRIDFAPQAAVRPHIAIGVDMIRFSDGDGDLESVSPHLGLGLNADMGLGEFSISLDGAEVFDDTRATSLTLGYSASF